MLPKSYIEVSCSKVLYLDVLLRIAKSGVEIRHCWSGISDEPGGMQRKVVTNLQ